MQLMKVIVYFSVHYVKMQDNYVDCRIILHVEIFDLKIDYTTENQITFLEYLSNALKHLKLHID